MDTITDTHDLIIVGGGAAVVESATVARLNGLHPMVVPMIPTRVDLLHRPLRVWDGDRELRGRAVVIAADDGPLPAVYRDWLAHDRYGNLLTEDDSTRTNVEGVFAAGREAARGAPVDGCHGGSDPAGRRLSSRAGEPPTSGSAASGPGCTSVTVP